VYTEAFLCLLRHHYWHQLDHGEFEGSSGTEAELLLTSVSLAFQLAGHHLADLDHILVHLLESHSDTGADAKVIQEILDDEGKDAPPDEAPKARAKQETNVEKKGMFSKQRRGSRSFQSARKRKTCVDVLRSFPRLLAKHNREKERTKVVICLESLRFTIGMSATLIINAIFILMEQTIRKGDNYHNKAWIGIEIAFTVIFTLEFIIKFIGDKWYYYLDSWNIFDFLLLLLSYFGLIMEVIAGSKNDSGGSDVSNEARIFRFNRLFRVLRVLRLFRLFKFMKQLIAKMQSDEISLILEEHVRTITITRAFINAHLRSQKDLLKYFGNAGQPSCVECARVLLESQEEVYKAYAIAAGAANSVDEATLLSMTLFRDNIATTSRLSSFVLEALEKGCISSREAETITHALDNHIRFFCVEMKRTASGRTTTSNPVRHSDVLETGISGRMTACSVTSGVEGPLSPQVSSGPLLPHAVGVEELSAPDAAGGEVQVRPAPQADEEAERKGLSEPVYCSGDPQTWAEKRPSS